MNIYVASSWRNLHQPAVVEALRQAGHEVYDFRNPAPGNSGFAWSSIDPNWQAWTPEQYLEALAHPIARAGFRLDMNALEACEACVLVMPCGRSAHLELGHAAGADKKTFVLLDGPSEPELMYGMTTRITTSLEQLLAAIQLTAPAPGCRTCGEGRGWVGRVGDQINCPDCNPSTSAPVPETIYLDDGQGFRAAEAERAIRWVRDGVEWRGYCRCGAVWERVPEQTRGIIDRQHAGSCPARAEVVDLVDEGPKGAAT
jgi:hypothetical protein